MVMGSVGFLHRIEGVAQHLHRRSGLIANTRRPNLLPGGVLLPEPVGPFHNGHQVISVTQDAGLRLSHKVSYVVDGK